MHVKKSKRSFIATPRRIEISSSSIRWRYLFQSSGFHVIMVQVSSGCSDLISTNLTFESGIHVQQRLVSVDLCGPRNVPIYRIPVAEEWHASLVPSSFSGIFIWSSFNNEVISVHSKFALFKTLNPGTYELSLTVLNSFTELNASMQFQATVTLVVLNISITDFFVGHNGSLSVTINQPSLPDTIFVDFGDDSIFHSTTDHDQFEFENLGSHSCFIVVHCYHSAGLHTIYFNASNSISHLEHSININVEVPISGVVLELLSPSVVALFEDVLVQCVVENGSNLNFEWDFGDGTDGQYTMVNSTKNRSLANHSYGVADLYNITVRIFNDHESVVVHFNTSIQAVEPIEKLHLRPRTEQYAAPLLERKSDFSNNTCLYSTDTIVFEAWVWRGSDVQFLFDFGDGVTKLTHSELNVWSLPWATVKHFYCAEGEYEVSVMATNPIDSVNKTLQPFYVQVAPEGLALDKQYYIVQHMSNVTMHASVTKGTNISFNWMLNNEQLNITSKTLFLSNLIPGIYIISVEVFNKVTDLAYKSIKRPKVSSKLFVQEKLLEIQLCLKIADADVCGENEIKIPSDEEIKFIAKVIPPAEMSLRFTWQLSATEVQRTTKPFLLYKYKNPGRYNVNVTVQNHISSISSSVLTLHLIQRIANLTSIHCQGPNLVNHNITFRALYWFGTNLTFQWDFGDGSSVLNTHSSFVQHIYKEVGEYWVSVNVWNKFSHANLTTNMFFLHHLCQKPEITFLNDKESSSYADDILIEAEISTNCEKNSIKYTWKVENSKNGIFVPFNSADMLQQRYLMIPRYSLKPGTYKVHLKVEMSNFIVYAQSSTVLKVNLPDAIAFINGGYLRWIGYNDTIDMMAGLWNLQNTSQPVSYSWSCLPLFQKHLYCFSGTYPHAFISNDVNSFQLSASSFTPTLTSIVINVTIETVIQASTSQILEIKDVPHVLLIDIECSDCQDHQINQNAKLKLKANCRNCQNENVEYIWKIWRIEEGRHQMHFSNYECVQADGSTFFIIAPNTTLFLPVNDTFSQDPISLDSSKSTHYISSDQLISDDIPPFPNLPGFPEESSSRRALKLHRSIRDSSQHLDDDPSEFTPYQQYPFEEEAHYDTNTTLFNLTYPDFLPFSPFDHMLVSPDYPMPEEGLPGESGSAVARDQSSQRFNVHLSEDEGEIEEGDGKPRIDSEGVLGPNTNHLGDPVRDGSLNPKPSTQYFLNRPRTVLSLNSKNTTTGFHSKYFILKPGALQVGNSYLIEVTVRDTDTGMEGSAMEFFKINTGPINGRCTLMPIKGFSMNFNFRMHCLEWKSDHQPLYYELRYSLAQGDPGHIVYFGLNRNVKFVLPAGNAADSFNVYINVIIRNNLGALTKVCSLIREVKPLPLNITLMQYVYNETFHPQSQLAKYLAERQNQALLHQVHILSSSVNSYVSTKGLSSKEKSLKEQIRFRFLEIIENLKIFSIVEAVQALSCLSEILTDIPEITMFELQKVYNIYQKFHDTRLNLYGYTQEALQQEFMVLLSKLIFAVHSVYLRNEELIRIGRELFLYEIKEKMKNQLIIEEPLTVEVPHIFTRSAYISFKMNGSKVKQLILPLKLTRIQIFNEDFNFISKHIKKRVKKCLDNDCIPHDICFLLIAQEFDYVSMPHYLNFAQLLPMQKSSLLLTFLSCDTFDNLLSGSSLNFTVKFSRNQNTDVLIKSPLTASYMNVHQVNITEDDVYHSLLFHVRFNNMNLSEFNYQVEALFRYETWPTPRKYSWKRNFPIFTMEHSFFIPQDYVKAPGMYYFSLWIPSNENNVVSIENIAEYNITIWKDVCLGKAHGMWSTHICNSLNSTNHNWMNCKCAAQEMTAYAVPLLSSIHFIPTSDLIEPYFNVLLLVIFFMSLVAYFVLVFINLHKDGMKNLRMTPMLVRDNNDKHKQLYLICVKTGMYFSSGTTASVFVVLHGMKGMTETRQLIDVKAKKFSFQKGSVDFFLMSTEVNLGPLIKLEVWHNNYGSSPSWYLKCITVKDLKTDSSYQFDCNKWLSADKDDQQIERELPVADTVPTFISVFWDNFITYIHDLNMWNSVVCESPTSFFTGVQRLTCCLCFYLNCAFLSSLLLEQILEKEEQIIPHISHITFPICILISAVATFPQSLLTILFRFSKTPHLKIDPIFSKLCCSLSLHHLYCWLRQKRSNSSHSSHRSDSTMGGSDSMYSSFEESSIMSIPELMEESFTTEDKDEFLSSMSTEDISDPVSPLQKTLSTWQAFENWVRKKHEIIIKPEVASRRQQISIEKSDSALMPEEILLNELDCNDDDITSNSNELQQHEDTDSESSGNLMLGACEDNSDRESIELTDHLNACFHLPCLHYLFYYMAWCILISNILLALVFTFIKASNFSMTKCSFWLKHIFIEILCSSFIITPFLIIVFSFVSALKFYIQKMPKAALFYDLQNAATKNETEDIKPKYNRIEYLKRYLRPPREQILEEFRKLALKETNIIYIASNLWNYVLMLILLLTLSLPEDTKNRYLQRTSIFNTFFRPDVSAWQQPMNSTLQLCNWLEYDFIDGLYGEEQCLDQYLDCGITPLTGCILVGKPFVRIFKMPMCTYYITSNCHNSDNNANNSIDEYPLYERVQLKGYNGLYFQEDQVIVMNDDKYETQERIYNIVPYLLNLTSGAVSVELLLFNPVLSTFVPITFLFEITDSGILLTKDILHAKVPEMSSLLFHTNFSLHLFYMLIISVKCKNQCWQMLKQRKLFWKEGWNYSSVLFNAVSIGYLIVYVIYTINLKNVSKLEDANFALYLNAIDSAYFEMICHNLLSFLIFMHIIGALEILNFSLRLKKLIKKLTNSMKIILSTFLVLLLLISICNFMLTYFIGTYDNLSNPFIILLKTVHLIFKGFRKAEVKNNNHSLDKLFSTVVIFVIVVLHIFFLSFLRSILINTKCSVQRTREKITLKDARKAFKKRIADCLKSKSPQIVEKSDQVPPVEFLLLELEQLADKLMAKAQNLFGEKNICEEIMLDSKLCSLNVEGYLQSQCQLLEKSGLELAFEKNQLDCAGKIQTGVNKRLNATIPRETKSHGKIFSPSSLNASLASQRKFNYQTASINLSASLQSHKIRKTYPLCQLDVGSSSESISDDDTVNGVSVRKTKSRGKGKYQDLNLTVLDDSPSSQ